MESAASDLHARYPVLNGLQTALVGYSMGTEVVRHCRMTCPRVYVAGPGWHDRIASSDRLLSALPPPGGPSLQLFSSPDALMSKFGLSLDAASASTGHPHPDTRTRIRPGELLQPPEGGLPPHLRVDFERFDHGHFKFRPLAEAEDSSWKRICCGIDPWRGARNEPNANDSNALKVQHADESAEVICRWLLLVM